jgi:hypothetical protein
LVSALPSDAYAAGDNDEERPSLSSDPTNTGARAPKKRFLTKRRVGRAAAALVVLLGLAQFVPYGRSTQNPPVTRAAKFPDVRAQQLMATSCNDCHSNLTKR